MSWDIITIICTALGTLLTAVPVGVWVGMRQVRAKYQAEIDTLRADVQQKLADARSQELENVRKAADILTQGIVPPLEKQIKKLNDEVERLNTVLERIWGCPHVDHCPVKYELLRTPRNGNGNTRRGGGDKPSRGTREQRAAHPNRGDPDGSNAGADVDGD